MKYFIFILSILFFSLSGQAKIVNGWEVQVNQKQTLSKLESEKEVQIYTGDIMLERIEKVPSKNHHFVLVQVSLERMDATAQSFDAKMIQLKIDSKIFNRLNDDSFMAEYNKAPLTHLKVKRGFHQGFLIFEVPDTLINKEGHLTYQGEML